MKIPATIRGMSPPPLGNFMRISDRLHMVVYRKLDLVVLIQLRPASLDPDQAVISNTIGVVDLTLQELIAEGKSSILPDLRLALRTLRAVKEDASKT